MFFHWGPFLQHGRSGNGKGLDDRRVVDREGLAGSFVGEEGGGVPILGVPWERDGSPPHSLEG